MADITIALDAMGGDHGPSVVVPAAIKSLKTHPELQLILVGDETILAEYLPTQMPERMQVLHTTEVVSMDELPSVALRTKKNSSMRVAINLVKEGRANACVSAGNTGALMATARFVLKTMPGIDRPAIITTLPAIDGHVRMLDLGANVDSCAENLCQFAVMGSVLTTAIDNIERPKVGLLNIGTEEIKGNDQVKHTAHLLSQIEALNYIGYVEGDDILTGKADVIVCDGFIGNVALKAIEGVANLVKHFMKDAFNQNLYSRLAGLITLPVLKNIKKQIDPSGYNGASFLGLQGSVIKSHGSANELAFSEAINEAILSAQNNVPELIHNRVAEILHDGVYT